MGRQRGQRAIVDPRSLTADLEAVARDVRRLQLIGDLRRRGAVAMALRLRGGAARLAPAARARIRGQILTALTPAAPTLGDRVVSVLAALAHPRAALLRLIAVPPAPRRR